MLKKLAIATSVILAGGGWAFWAITAPVLPEPSAIAPAGTGQVLEADASRGEQVFWAGGCASCHSRPGADGEARLELAGGVELKTDFGTFIAPNISPHPTDGIGGWSESDFTNAMQHGISPEGEHYYPAFPYPSYARMRAQDVADLFAFMKTLPPVEGRTAEHELAFPYNLRRGIGLWKKLYLSDQPVVRLAAGAPDEVQRGQYLVEGAGHCGECHTPRLFTGGAKLDQWLAGAAAAEGDGIVPNITPGDDGLASWSVNDIAYYLQSGFTPDFDSVGGAMVSVQKNMAQLSDEDRRAIAAYLKAVPPAANGYPSSR